MNIFKISVIILFLALILSCGYLVYSNIIINKRLDVLENNKINDKNVENAPGGEIIDNTTSGKIENTAKTISMVTFNASIKEIDEKGSELYVQSLESGGDYIGEQKISLTPTTAIFTSCVAEETGKNPDEKVLEVLNMIFRNKECKNEQLSLSDLRQGDKILISVSNAEKDKLFAVRIEKINN